MQNIFLLQEKMDYSGTPILYCIQKQSKMIHNILLQLIRRVVKHKDINEKIKAFCNWTIIVDLIILQLDNAGSMKKFLIYYIIHNLLNLILNERHSVLQATVCKYLKWFFQQVLPSHTEIFGSDLLVTVINVLIPFVEVDSLTGQESLQLLEWLIVEKIDLIHDTVGILDPFPEVDKFQRINDIYKQVRYEYGTISLEDEIKHFLMPTKKSKIPVCRTEGLNKLKKQLSSKKHELKELYEKLYNVRGFSEDAEKSVLHQLICTLIKLATCTDKKVGPDSSQFGVFKYPKILKMCCENLLKSLSSFCFYSTSLRNKIITNLQKMWQLKCTLFMLVFDITFSIVARDIQRTGISL